MNITFGDNAWIFIVIALWTAIWKGFALWRAARNNSKPWFVALFIVNTLGILEILYLFVIGKTDRSKQ
jgi:hypothetical protein